jgi:hypothetical protein
LDESQVPDMPSGLKGKEKCSVLTWGENIKWAIYTHTHSHSLQCCTENKICKTIP